MRITSTAVSLNVDDVPASSTFLAHHFGFREEMAADGFASLTREDAGVNVVFLRRGLATLPADQRDAHAPRLTPALAADDPDRDPRRPQHEGAATTMPPTAEESGERAFQPRHPNAVIVQLADWRG